MTDPAPMIDWRPLYAAAGRAMADRDTGRAALARVHALIVEEYDRAWDLSELAAVAGYPPPTSCGATPTSTGSRRRAT